MLPSSLHGRIYGVFAQLAPCRAMHKRPTAVSQIKQPSGEPKNIRNTPQKRDATEKLRLLLFPTRVLTRSGSTGSGLRQSQLQRAPRQDEQPSKQSSCRAASRRPHATPGSQHECLTATGADLSLGPLLNPVGKDTQMRSEERRV